ncbi:hypothetical protein FACS189485_08250 [Spirochaetia bacterium]|nr:hypothetical protein FACS189485_08250 [Spirochaetia bacterium]
MSRMTKELLPRPGAWNRRFLSGGLAYPLRGAHRRISKGYAKGDYGSMAPIVRILAAVCEGK